MPEVPVNRFILGFALLLTLAGCGTTNLHSGAIGEADARAAAIFADCDAQLRGGKLTSYRQAVECARQPVLVAYGTAGYPFMDLVLFDLQERDLGADRIDHGEAQPADVQRDIAVLDQRLKAEADRRIAARSGVGGAVPSARPEQLLAGLPTLLPQLAPTADTNCFTVGSFTRCNNQPPSR
jgi:hypothetical protein